MGQKTFAIAVVIFILGLGVYFLRQQPFEKLGKEGTFSLDFLSFFTGATSTEATGTRITAPPPPPFPSPPPPTPVPEPTVDPRDVPEGFTVRELSPWFRKVRIGSFSPGDFTYRGSVSLYTYLKEGELVNVTGWKFQGNYGSAVIPRAIDIYEPSGLAPEGEIYLRDRDYVNIYTNTSAIGKNFRLNKCLGFLGQYNKFDPALPQNCPTDYPQGVTTLSGRCQDYLRTLGYCRVPENDPPVPQDDYACREFLKTVNYAGCLDRHRFDKDFLDREWRVWIGSRFADPRHDRILLLDRQGLLVDMYTY